MKTGIETMDLFCYFTTDPSEPVASIHPKAMPIILTEPEEIEIWMTVPWASSLMGRSKRAHLEQHDSGSVFRRALTRF